MTFFEIRPVLFKSICISGYDVSRQNTAHNKVHSCKVICILSQFLCIIFYSVCITHIFCCGLTNIYKQRAGAACGVIYFYLVPVFKMMSNYFTHKQRYFVRSVEFSCFLAGVCRKIGDKIFIDETKHIIVLLAVHRNIFYKVKQVAYSFCL